MNIYAMGLQPAGLRALWPEATFLNRAYTTKFTQ